MLAEMEDNLELVRANRCRVGDGMRVPVEETDEAEEPSSSRLRSGLAMLSKTGASGGNLANFDLAKDFWKSLMGFVGAFPMSIGAMEGEKIGD